MKVPLVINCSVALWELHHPSESSSELRSKSSSDLQSSCTNCTNIKTVTAETQFQSDSSAEILLNQRKLQQSPNVSCNCEKSERLRELLV